jgi:hypothetical protein
MNTADDYTAIELSLSTRSKVKYWKISRVGKRSALCEYSAYSNTVTKAMKKARKRFPEGTLKLSGLTMYAETKPLLFDFPHPRLTPTGPHRGLAHRIKPLPSIR